jgi:hypothetical protein
MRLFLTKIASLMALAATAQQTNITQTTHDLINFSQVGVPKNGSGGLFSFDASTRTLLGTTYEDSTFRAGNVRFYGKLPGTQVDSLLGVPLRYDVYAHQLDISAGGPDIRVAPAERVRYFAMNNLLRQRVEEYINVRELRGEADELRGFFEVLVAGKATLLRYPSVRVKKADYNPALNTGSRDDKLVWKETWYAAQPNRRAVEFSPSKKGILSLFADKEAEMETYLKTQKPDLKTRAGLAAAFAHYNSL